MYSKMLALVSYLVAKLSPCVSSFLMVRTSGITPRTRFLALRAAFPRLAILRRRQLRRGTLPATRDLVGLWQEASDAFDRRDFDAAMSVFAPDAVWEVQPLGISFEGAAAIRGFLEDWRGDYQDYESDQEEGHNLGTGWCLR